MVKVVVASRNPVKMDAVREGLSAFISGEIELTGVAVDSGVSDQPMDNSETLTGAETRVKMRDFSFREPIIT